MTDRNKIMELVQEELHEANNVHPLFHSLHEAWAVIWEEFEETKADKDRCETYLKRAWNGCKEDDSEEFLAEVDSAKHAAIGVAQEAIQVAAMCQKALESNIDAE